MNARYGATYAIDTPGLREALGDGIPVLHFGQVEAVPAIKDVTPEARWLVVALWCARDVAHARLLARDPSDVITRLRVWDETSRLTTSDQEIDTGRTGPMEAATRILGAVKALAGPCPRWAEGRAHSGPHDGEVGPRGSRSGPG
jgi:guanylate kinase